MDPTNSNLVVGDFPLADLNLDTDSIRNLRSIQTNTYTQSDPSNRPLGQAVEDPIHRMQQQQHQPLTEHPREELSSMITKEVRMPTSDYVAEIVGVHGVGIMNIIKKTGATITTPKRGEEPVFTVHGQAENVAAAVDELNSSKDHFVSIREKRAAVKAGHISIHIRVPEADVGWIIGTKGAVVKKMEKETKAKITSPKRGAGGYFVVEGIPDSVAKAVNQIQQVYIKGLRNRGEDPEEGLKRLMVEPAAVQMSAQQQQPLLPDNNNSNNGLDHQTENRAHRNNNNSLRPIGSGRLLPRNCDPDIPDILANLEQGPYVPCTCPLPYSIYTPDTIHHPKCLVSLSRRRGLPPPSTTGPSAPEERTRRPK